MLKDALRFALCRTILKINSVALYLILVIVFILVPQLRVALSIPLYLIIKEMIVTKGNIGEDYCLLIARVIIYIF